jgi:hypothetical protein
MTERGARFFLSKKFFDGKIFEKIFLARKDRFEGADCQGFSKTPWAGQKEALIGRFYYFRQAGRFISAVKTVLSKAVKD